MKKSIISVAVLFFSQFIPAQEKIVNELRKGWKFVKGDFTAEVTSEGFKPAITRISTQN